MELKDYWAAVRAGWAYVAACVVGALVVGGALAAWSASDGAQASAPYVAARKVFVAIEPGARPARPPLVPPSAQAQMASYAELAGGALMADAVSDEVGYDVQPGVLVSTAVPGASVMTMVVERDSKDEADEIVDAAVDLLPDMIGQVDTLGTSGDSDARVSLISWSTTTAVAGPSSTPRILLLALLIGAGFGLGWATLRYAGREAAPSEPGASEPGASSVLAQDERAD